MINPELQFSGNNEVATVKLDIFGEIVVTLGTTPQGQGHETTASQVVADILKCSVDDVHVRAGHDSYWNSHAGFSGTYATQFAVTGLSAVKGATEMLRDEIFKLAGAVFGGVPAEALELADGGVRIKENPEAFLPFMACGAIINANNAGLPEDLGVTLNCRYVYRPPFEVPDVEQQVRQPHADLRGADPCRGDRDRPGDRLLRHRRLRRRRRLRQPHQPADRRGPGDGRDRAGARRRDARDTSSTTRTATCSRPTSTTTTCRTRSTCRRCTPAPSRARRRSRRSARRAWARAAAPGIHAVCAAVQDALRGRGGAIV